MADEDTGKVVKVDEAAIAAQVNERVAKVNGLVGKVRGLLPRRKQEEELTWMAQGRR